MVFILLNTIYAAELVDLDLDGDKTIGVGDIIEIIRSFGNITQGREDVTKDGKVDFFDLIVIARNIGKVISSEAEQMPYDGLKSVPGIIEAEEYDTGGEGIAFHDTTQENDYNEFRNEGVYDFFLK